MTEIKVGQVWEVEKSKLLIITRISEPHNNVIFNDGYTTSYSKTILNHCGILLAEYLTWQEAVNSKEFKGVI